MDNVATLDEPLRVDETPKRLLDWTYPQSERLAAQVLDAEDYKDIDPSHPLGGPDDGRDGECTRHGEKGVWAVYFPRGQQTLNAIEKKLKDDIASARKHESVFLAFVTNQELRLAQRDRLRSLGGDIRIDLFHLDRVATILDRPRMGTVREQYLCIPASSPPPLSIKVSVLGNTHSFTDDVEVLERFVGLRESQIREKSDEGHARVRAQQEATARAAREKREREARAAAEKARRERMDAAIPKRPWDVGIDFPRASDFNVGLDLPRASDLFGPSRLMDSIASQYSAPQMLAHIPGMPEPPKPPEPLTDQQIKAKVARYRAGLESRWPSCRDYLGGIAWPGLRFRIKNEAKSALTDVEVILTFHGARGIDFKDLKEFHVHKVQDPSWEPARHPVEYTVTPLPRLARPAEYPIEWRHNDAGDLDVTIRLQRLRPHPEWRSDDYGEDIVLVVDPGTDLDEVTVTYTATANDYGDVFEGEPISVPVEKVAMLDVLREVMEAAEEQS